MRSSGLKKLSLLMACAIGLSACGGPDIALVAAENNLSKNETEALAVCDDGMTRKKPLLQFGKEQRRLSEVPIQICVCHAKDMAKVYKPGKYSTYTFFAGWLPEPNMKSLPPIVTEDIRLKQPHPKIIKRLFASFERCAKEFVAANEGKEEFADLLETLPPPPPPPEKAQTASN
jgi:hypothetical protein